MPNHKLTYSITYDVTKKFSLNLNGFFTTQVQSYEDPDFDWVDTPANFESLEIINFYASYDSKNWELGFGVSDILNEKQEYPPAYANQSGLIPSMSREFFIKAALKF